jgi:hypothetical protein
VLCLWGRSATTDPADASLTALAWASRIGVEQGPRGVAVLAVSAEKKSAPVRFLAGKLGWSDWILYGPEFARSFEGQSLPVCVVIDNQGLVRDVSNATGHALAVELRESLDELSTEKH